MSGAHRALRLTGLDGFLPSNKSAFRTPLATAARNAAEVVSTSRAHVRWRSEKSHEPSEWPEASKQDPWRSTHEQQEVQIAVAADVQGDAELYRQGIYIEERLVQHAIVPCRHHDVDGVQHGNSNRHEQPGQSAV